MLVQRNLHFLIPVISFTLFSLPPLVFTDTFDNFNNGFSREQLEEESGTSLSSSKTKYDTDKFVQDSVPAAFDWGTNGVSVKDFVSYM